MINCAFRQLTGRRVGGRGGDIGIHNAEHTSFMRIEVVFLTNICMAGMHIGVKLIYIL